MTVKQVLDWYELRPTAHGKRCIPASFLSSATNKDKEKRRLLSGVGNANILALLGPKATWSRLLW